MFQEIDLSQAVPRGTTAVTFRYHLHPRDRDVPLVAWLSDNPRGEHPIPLNEPSGQVTVRFRTGQRLYYRLDARRLHLNLWIVEYDELKKHSC